MIKNKTYTMINLALLIAVISTFIFQVILLRQKSPNQWVPVVAFIALWAISRFVKKKFA